MSLKEYQEKRNFADTIEPTGKLKASIGNPIYVVQKHDASHPHYDLRLEARGVLKSWAIPKGIPNDHTKRLAVQTEDHPIDYASFEGIIQKGNYGAGTVEIWDKGTFKPIALEEDKLIIDIKGEKVNGRYCLIRMKRSRDNGKNWLLFKLKG